MMKAEDTIYDTFLHKYLGRILKIYLPQEVSNEEVKTNPSEKRLVSHPKEDGGNAFAMFWEWEATCMQNWHLPGDQRGKRNEHDPKSLGKEPT